MFKTTIGFSSVFFGGTKSNTIGRFKVVFSLHFVLIIHIKSLFFICKKSRIEKKGMNEQKKQHFVFTLT